MNGEEKFWSGANSSSILFSSFFTAMYLVPSYVS